VGVWARRIRLAERAPASVAEQEERAASERVRDRVV
jgi:hypothetical protein